MELQRESCDLLELLLQPGFCVKENRIVAVNAAARGLSLGEGLDLTPLLATGAEEYAGFSGGCLYLSLSLPGGSWGASVTRTEAGDIFLLDPDTEDSELRAMALAARELSRPLSSLISISDNLLPAALPEQEAKTRELLARMSRSLYQMQRTLSNMSDAGLGSQLFQPEYRNIPGIFEEIFEKAAALLETAGMGLTYDGPKKDIYGLIDARQMERAVLNILSNAMKFRRPGGVIRATLTQRDTTLRLSILDDGEGVGEGMGSLFSRYLRQPGLEDSRHGIGLGMVLVRSAAANHGGVVLIDQPEAHGTRVTLTLKLRKAQSSQLRSPVTVLSGGRDQALIELSECLPLSVYEKER